MGSGISLKCSKCNYFKTYYTGIGMTFPKEYKEVVKDIKSGKYGADWQQYFLNRKDVVVNANKELYHCSKCGNLQTEYDLGLYAREENIDEERVPIFGYMRKERYKYIRGYYHKCPECGNRMTKINPNNLELPCPKCGNILERDLDILWD